MKYGHTKKVNLPFEEATEAIKETLAQEGFGVLTEIDVKETMKKKLGIDYDSYVILGACNPSFANKALQLDKEIGLLLPCNVIVYEDGGNVYVSSTIPSATMSMVENNELASIAGEVEEKLQSAVDSLE